MYRESQKRKAFLSKVSLSRLNWSSSYEIYPVRSAWLDLLLIWSCLPMFKLFNSNFECILYFLCFIFRYFIQLILYINSELKQVCKQKQELIIRIRIRIRTDCEKLFWWEICKVYHALPFSSTKRHWME